MGDEREPVNIEPRRRSLQGEVWRVAALLGALPTAPKVGHRLKELAASFANLRTTDDAARVKTEDQIWAIWCDHREPQAKVQMSSGVSRLADGELEQAETIFGQIIEHYPQWSEAWNKRATVCFLQGRDAASIRDIYCTLELEPRHFGALGGFAQICMRNGTPDAALAALERLLAVNPGAPSIAEVVARLRKNTPTTLH